MNDIKVTIEGLTYVLFEEYNADYFAECFGWYQVGVTGRHNTGNMYNGKPYSVSRAKWKTFDQAVDDLAGHIRYYGGQSRVLTKQQIEEAK